MPKGAIIVDSWDSLEQNYKLTPLMILEDPHPKINICTMDTNPQISGAWYT